MKTKIIVACCLLTGLGLAAGLYLHQNPSPGDDVVSAMAPAVANLPASAASASPAAVPRFFTNCLTADWRAVESDDYRKYVANLRAIGCPEETIRDIITGDVNKLFEAREKALAGSTNKFEYWKRETARIDEPLLKQARELAREKRAVLRELLGVDPPEKSVASVDLGTARREQMLSFLPREKQEQLAEVEADFSVKAQTLRAGKARASKSDLESLRGLEAQMHEAVAQVLTPQEKEEFDLRASRTANYLRATLGEFEMGEQEFRSVLKLRQEFDRQFSFTDHQDPQRVAAEVDLEKQIRAALGDERYTQYMREQNWSVSSLRSLAEEHGIPKEDAVQVFDLKQPALEQASRIRQDAALSPDQRQEALQALQQQTVKAAAQFIGAEAAQAYQRDGSWIRNLARTK